MTTSDIMSLTIYEMILEHAKQTYPAECCGVIAEGAAFKGVNLAGENSASDYFVLDGSFVAKYEVEGTLKAIYHSHPIQSPEPSTNDLYGIINSGYPWVIINPINGQFTITTPEQASELLKKSKEKQTNEFLGREFVWGHQDCYQLASDIYRTELNIDLPKVDRGMLFAWEDDASWNKFADNFELAGFEFIHKGALVETHRVNLQKYDVILFAINSTFGNSNHCGVVIDPQVSMFYHHLYGRLSEASIYGGFYHRITTGILRHKQLLKD